MLDVRLSEWCCSVSILRVQIPSREEKPKKKVTLANQITPFPSITSTMGCMLHRSGIKKYGKLPKIYWSDDDDVERFFNDDDDQDSDFEGFDIEDIAAGRNTILAD
jgi:hypothetical protein